MENKTKTGVNIIKTGYNKLLKFLKNTIFIFNFELKLNKKSGAKPTNIIKKCLIKTKGAYKTLVCSNCLAIEALDTKKAQDI